MRFLARARFALASAAAHALALAALKLLPAYQSQREAHPIEVAIRSERPAPPPVEAPPPPVPPTVAPPIAAPPAATDRLATHAPPRPDRELPPPFPSLPPDQRTGTGAPPETPPVAPGTPPSGAPPPPGKPNLFAHEALEKAVPSSTGVVLPGRPSAWGGTTRRAGDGLPEPNQRDKYADREEAAAKIHEFYDQSSGEERARSGRVPPRWRDAERQIGLAFSPPAAMVTDDNRGESWLKQMVSAKPQGGTTARGVDPSTEVGAAQAYAQSLAGQAASGNAASWVRTEIEVVIDDQGRVVSSRVLRHSGRRKFDQAALDAVLKAVDGHGVLDEKGAVVTKWAVEAAVAVAPPTSLGFSFDESSGKLGGSYPMKREVKTKVALLSVLPK